MKYLQSLCVVLMLLCFMDTNAQQQYTVDGQQYSLKTEVEGTLTLLWNTINGEYRYFSKKGSEIVELKNTRSGGNYQEEYKETLRLQTDGSASTDDIKLTKGSLSRFFDDYNRSVDPNYTSNKSSIELKFRFGAFAGVSNSIFTMNPQNTLLPVAGVDLEMIDEVKLKRHALVLRFKQTFENSDYKYSASQFSLNYRFKFVKTQTFDIFVNGKFVSYTHVSREFIVVEDNGAGGTITRIETASGGDIQAPATFGLGADVALGNGFLTFNYNDIVGIGVDSNGEFPVDFTVGYKFKL